MKLSEKTAGPSAGNGSTPVRPRLIGIAGLVLLCSGMSGVLGAEKPTAIPDLIHGGKPDSSHDCPLGPTGARGWIWGWKCQTTDARQILITEVAKGSPADGILEKNDVILGVDAKFFDTDARIRFAKAVTEAETEAKRGNLKLVRWRKGKTDHIELHLTVLGSYAPTAPYDCRKSQLIFSRGCQAIAKRGLKDSPWENAMNGLALLASGRKEYQQLVAHYAHTLGTSKREDFQSWRYGYDVLFLAEYALATGDPSVMMDLQRLSLDIAHGQSAVGSWGHDFARRDKGLDGYGCMNQPGIVCTLAMALAREAGVKDPELDKAITLGAGFVRWYVHKGSVPYGDHLPWHWHDDNGKNGSATVLFDLLGDSDAAGYYARMGMAAYGERESGHTGNFFNIVWALPGVSRCGPQGTAAYLKEVCWYYDLARGWDGRCSYIGLPGEAELTDKYTKWDCTGAFLLGYALPSKSLYITGRKKSCVKPLTKDEISATIDAGCDFTFWTEQTCYDGRSTETLLTGLSSWSPAVRRRSAQALGHRSDDIIPSLRKLLEGKSVEGRYGALEALKPQERKGDALAPQVRAMLASPDPWLRSLAAQALLWMGPEARAAAVPDLLRAMAIKDPADQRERSQEFIASALFAGSPALNQPPAILEKSLDTVDRPSLYAAIRELLANEDARIRMKIKPLYALFTPADFKELLPDIVKTVRNPAPSGEMYNYEHRLAGLDELTKLRIREGITICADMLGEGDEPVNENLKREQHWRWGINLSRIADNLAQYGGAAKDLLPLLGKARDRRAVQKWGGEQTRKDIEAIDRAMKVIDADKNPAPVISVKEYIARH